MRIKLDDLTKAVKWFENNIDSHNIGVEINAEYFALSYLQTTIYIYEDDKNKRKPKLAKTEDL